MIPIKPLLHMYTVSPFASQDSDGRQYIQHLVEQREALRPPKINNSKKRKLQNEQSETRRCRCGSELADDAAMCERCGAVCELPAKRARLASVACSRCGDSRAPIADERTADYICSGCGTVVAEDRMPSVGYADGVSVMRAPVCARENYFRERMSQWLRLEPAIPLEAQTKLRTTYRALRDGDGPIRLSDVLTKSEVRYIVISAGLPPKKLVEKWLTIRAMLRGVDDCPAPRQSLVDALVQRFRVFLRAWKQHPELHKGRDSVLSSNFLICNFLLLESAEDYDTHAKWFPQVTESKRKILWQMWVKFCILLDWPIYTAEYDADGKLHRKLQRVLGKRTR